MNNTLRDIARHAAAHTDGARYIGPLYIHQMADAVCAATLREVRAVFVQRDALQLERYQHATNSFEEGAKYRTYEAVQELDKLLASLASSPEERTGAQETPIDGRCAEKHKTGDRCKYDAGHPGLHMTYGLQLWPSGEAAPAVPPKVQHMKDRNGITLCGAVIERGNSYYEWAYVDCPACLATRPPVPLAPTPPETQRALDNVYMLARREVRRIERRLDVAPVLAPTLERWQHVLRICEEAGGGSAGILRRSLPTELTEGESFPAPRSGRDAKVRHGRAVTSGNDRAVGLPNRIRAGHLMSAQVDQARDAVDAALLQIGTADAATDRVVGVIRAQTGINALIAAVRAEERQQPSDAFAMACLTADRVELQRQLAEERQTRSALVENAKIVLKGFGQNVFVRNTDGDGDSGWAIKVLPYIAALARLELALTRAGETK